MNQQVKIKPKHTRFRAYQLKNRSSSFSYWDGTGFTLGEARLNVGNINSVCEELGGTIGNRNIDNLHITGWDQDHCAFNELKEILTYLKPEKIETPGYGPNTPNGIKCEKLIDAYIYDNNAGYLNFSKEGLSHLQKAKRWEYNNVCWQKNIFGEANNDSSIKLFRSGCFTVLSLGDVESKEIAKTLMFDEIIKNEVDILILPHHGADNGFISNEFLKAVKPKVAIAMCDWDNQYKHPDPAITSMLYNNNIPYFSTKQGDIIIESVAPNIGQYQIWNYISSSEKLESVSKIITSKKLNHSIQPLLASIIQNKKLNTM